MVSVASKYINAILTGLVLTSGQDPEFCHLPFIRLKADIPTGNTIASQLNIKGNKEGE